jgi:hypothetical protein
MAPLHLLAQLTWHRRDAVRVDVKEDMERQAAGPVA